MKKFISSLKKKISKEDNVFDVKDEEYVELDVSRIDSNTRIIVRPFTLEEFEDVKPILHALRQQDTIALVNIKPLKDKDLVDLKRAINKIKQSCDAIDGDIAGFADDWIAAVPKFAKIYRPSKE